MNAITKGIARDNDEDFSAARAALKAAADELRDRADNLDRGGDAERARVLRGRSLTISAMADDPRFPTRRSRLGVTADDMSDWAVGEVESFGHQCRKSLEAVEPLVAKVKVDLLALREAAGHVPTDGDMRDALLMSVDDMTDMADDTFGDVIAALERSDHAVDEALEMANTA